MTNKKIVIMAIDPGCNHLGYSRIVYDPNTNQSVVSNYGCFSASELARKEQRKDVKEYGNVISLFMCEREIENIFNEFKPDFVVSESAFVHRFPQAFASLCLCISTIERVLYRHQKILYKIAPREAKKAIGDSSAGKEVVQDAIHHLPDLLVKHNKQRTENSMVEHEADSIAIGYAFIKNILPDILLNCA